MQHALDLDPKLTRARAQLAQVVKRQGDLAEAIRLYEIVATEVPDDAGVRDTLERWKRERELHERMRLEVGDHFTVSFEGPEDAAMAAQALESLNRAFWRICDVFGTFPTAIDSGGAVQRRAVSRHHAIAASGPPRPLTASSASRCAAPGRRARISIASSRTSSRTR